MKVYGLQLDIAWESKEANRQRIVRLLGERRPEQGALVVLPEMTCTGFTQRVEGLAESEGQETERFYQDLATRLGVTLVAGLTHFGAGGKGRNMAVVYSADGRKLTQYCKIHPFTFGGETQHFEKGDEVTTFPWGEAQVAPFICYDLRFPEIFRAVAGLEIFVVIANWPAQREEHWVTLLRARAIENQAYVMGVNRCGQDPNHSFSGRSLIVNPQGAVLADAGNQEGLIEASVDLAELRAYRQRFPALDDRRDLPCYHPVIHRSGGA